MINLSQTEKKDINALTKALKDSYSLKINVIYESTISEMANQEENETVHEYVYLFKTETSINQEQQQIN